MNAERRNIVGVGIGYVGKFAAGVHGKRDGCGPDCERAAGHRWRGDD